MSLEELRRGERWFGALIEHSTDAVVLLMQDGIVTYASPSTERVIGYTTEEFVGMNACDLIDSEDWEHVAWSELLDHPGDFISFQFRVCHKDGCWRWMEGTFTNLLNDPMISAIVGNYRDITERKREEEQLQQSEERYRVLVEQAADGIVLTDVEGYFVDVNTAACLLSGYNREELLTKNIGDLTREEDREGLFRGRDAIVAGKTLRSHWLMRRKDGSLIRTELSSKQLSNGYIQGIVHDISERILAEKERAALLAREQAARAEAEDLVRQLEAEKGALRQAERKYRALVDSNIIGVHVSDLNGKIYEANDCLAEMFGYTKEELLSNDFRWYQFIPPGYDKDQDPIAQTFESTGVVHLVEKEHVRKDGSCFPTLMAGAAFDREQKLSVMVFLDISEHKAAERRKQEFLGMVNHELRTPLTIILGFLELAQMELQHLPRHYSSAVDTVLNRVELALARANQQVSVESRLVEALLDVSRIETHKFELSLKECNLVPLVEEVLADQWPTAYNRRIELHLPEQEQVPVLVDKDRIGQVLINYLTNAHKYSPADSVISVALTVESAIARVFVCDQGSGLTPSEQEHVWEPFYQTEPSMSRGGEGGLGLGLYITKIIVQQHGGQVGVESEPGQGSTFWFTLPLVDA
jgi:PAS domain S-box-containing protein